MPPPKKGTIPKKDVRLGEAVARQQQLIELFERVARQLRTLNLDRTPATQRLSPLMQEDLNIVAEYVRLLIKSMEIADRELEAIIAKTLADHKDPENAEAHRKDWRKAIATRKRQEDKEEEEEEQPSSSSKKKLKKYEEE